MWENVKTKDRLVKLMAAWCKLWMCCCVTDSWIVLSLYFVYTFKAIAYHAATAVEPTWSFDDDIDVETTRHAIPRTILKHVYDWRDTRAEDSSWLMWSALYYSGSTIVCCLWFGPRYRSAWCTQWYGLSNVIWWSTYRWCYISWSKVQKVIRV